MFIFVRWLSKLLTLPGAFLLLMVWQAEKGPATHDRNMMMLALGIALILPYPLVRTFGEEKQNKLKRLFEQGNFYLGAGDFVTARDLYNNVESNAGASFSIPYMLRFNRAEAYLALQEYALALLDFEAFIKNAHGITSVQDQVKEAERKVEDIRKGLGMVSSPSVPAIHQEPSRNDTSVSEMPAHSEPTRQCSTCGEHVVPSKLTAHIRAHQVEEGRNIATDSN